MVLTEAICQDVVSSPAVVQYQLGTTTNNAGGEFGEENQGEVSDDDSQASTVSTLKFPMSYIVANTLKILVESTGGGKKVHWILLQIARLTDHPPK